MEATKNGAKTQHFRLSSQEWCYCKNWEKRPTSLESLYYHEIPEVKAFHLKGKATLSWNAATLEFLAKFAETKC